MVVNFNRDNIEKLNGKGKVIKSALLGGLLFCTLFLAGCNRTVFDTKYGFDKALIFGDDSAIVLDVKQWKDYSGEQIQLTTDDNFVLLTSSFDTNCFYGESTSYSIDDIALNGTSSEEVYYLNKDEAGAPIYNKDILDTNWKFNKAVTFNGNNALILPIGDWKDYSGEQLQVITPDGLTMILSSFNSKLIYDGESDISAYDFASSYVGSDGKVIDLAGDIKTDFNYDVIDMEFDFNKAIIVKDDSVVILPISEWCDYEGEQLQIKVVNGPTMVTAAYDTILLNDVTSKIKAIDIANALGKNVVDLADGYNQDGFFNKTVLDFNNGFTNVVFSNDNTSAILKIKEWCDYEGEQLQVKLDNGDVILSSSMMLDLINGGTSSINASFLGENYVNDGKVIDKSNGDISSEFYNKTVFDFNNGFNYALKVVDGNVTIIPLESWKDFYNNDGGENEADSPNCEQIQLVMPDGTAIVTTAYDTLLVKSSSDITEIAEYFKSEDGVISDLTSYVGKPTAGGWNRKFFDTKYKFDMAILNSGDSCQVFPIMNWLDFSEGEQLQLNLSDNTGFLTSFVNTTLVDPKTGGIAEILAEAFSGSLEKDKGLVKTYK